MLVENRNEESIGIWGAKIKEDSIEVSIIRTGKSKLSGVLLNQLVYRLINLTINKQKNYLIINDQYLKEEQKDILNLSGFIFRNDGWIKLVDAGVVDSHKYFSDNNLTNKYLDSELILDNLKYKGTSYKLGIERMLFPLKFKDLEIQTYIIPIKPYWAGQLFDHYIAGETLFGATPELSWNRENVYYRSVKPIEEEAPARILWYVSKGIGNYSNRRSCIVGCSYLDESYIAKPKDLFQKFKHYGIYKWKDIFNLAKCDIDNYIKGLKFSDTEIFENHIPLKKINEILISNDRKKNTFASPLKINNNIFSQIYILGTNR